MDYQSMEQRLKEVYRDAVDDYRRDDEIESRTDHHCWVWKTLADICTSFGREITVLDVGCGTGRYFHCLSNARQLTGMDLSPEMLAAARNPIRPELVSAKDIDLICGSVHTANFPRESFDFIYSVGVFGYGCPLTSETLNRFSSWLVPGGLLFIDVSDLRSMPTGASVRQCVKSFLYPMAPRWIRWLIESRSDGLPFFASSKTELRRLFRQSSFGDVLIFSRPCHSPCFTDAKLECVAARDEIRPRLVDRLQARVARF